MLQYFITASPRQIHVQQDQIGAGVCVLRIYLFEIVQRGLAVTQDFDLGVNPAAPDRFPDQKHVGLVVLDDENSRLAAFRWGL